MKVNNRYRLLTFIASVLAVCLLSTSADAQWWRWFRPRRPAPSAPVDLIPAARLVNWSAGTTVGVIGGIPTGRTQCVTTECQAVTNAAADLKDGTTNATTLIQAAVTSTLANTYVLLPCGLWRLNSGILIGPTDDNITLRGCDPDDPSQTTLDCRPTTCLFVGTGSDYTWAYPTTDNDIIAYAVDVPTGGTVLTVAATTAFSVGQIVRFRVANDPSLPVLIPAGNQNSRRQLSRVTAKSATTLTVFPPIYGYARFAGLAARVNVAQLQADGVGIEDLKLDGTNGTVVYGIWFEQTYGSWIKNVQLVQMNNYNVFLNDSLNCELRYSSLIDAKSGGSNGAGLLMNTVSACLVEDNIIRESFPNVEVNNGSSGNVVAYNFIRNNSGALGLDINHGGHNSFNLYEGNVVHNVIADGYHGSTSEDTLYRNLIYGNATGTPGFCTSLKRLTRNTSMVGNIFGTSSHVNSCTDSVGQPNMGNSSSTGTAQPSLGDFWQDWNQTTTLAGILTQRTDAQHGQITLSSGSLTNGNQGATIWLAGGTAPVTPFEVDAVAGNVYTVDSSPYGGTLPALDTAVIVWSGPNGFQELDLDVEATLYKRLNYYFSPAPAGIPAGEALPSGATFVNSLFRSAKPSWFGSLTWPPFNPSAPTEDFSAIPAGYRYENAGADPPP